MRLGTVCLFLVLTVLIVMAAFSVALRAAAEELTKRDPEVVAEVIGYMREGGPPGFAGIGGVTAESLAKAVFYNCSVVGNQTLCSLVKP